MPIYDYMHENSLSREPTEEKSGISRREWLAAAASGLGLVVSYGLLTGLGLFFVLPKKSRQKTRLLFAGRVDQYEIGAVKKFYDLQGNEILIKRGRQAFEAFNSTCPHLGCKVHWEEDEGRFLCPCHNGVFNPDGIAISGPPADEGQKLKAVPITIDKRSGVVYLEVEDIGKRRKA